MMALLLGLLRTDLLASDMSAVTRVIDILSHFTHKSVLCQTSYIFLHLNSSK